MLAIQALWFFLPILAANQCPAIASTLRLPLSRVRMSRQWLGENKTVGAYYVAPLGALVAIYAQRRMTSWDAEFGIINYARPDLWLVGFTFGLGAVLGDHVKSFIKRRIGIPSGARWWPFDQLDFAIGGIALASPLTGWMGTERFLVIIVFVLFIHPIGNRIGYFMGLRKAPW